MSDSASRQKGVTRVLIASAFASVSLVVIFLSQGPDFLSGDKHAGRTQGLVLRKTPHPHQIHKLAAQTSSSTDTRTHFDLTVQSKDIKTLIAQNNMFCCIRKGNDLHNMAYPYFYGNAFLRNVYINIINADSGSNSLTNLQTISRQIVNIVLDSINEHS